MNINRKIKDAPQIAALDPFVSSVEKLVDVARIDRVTGGQISAPVFRKLAQATSRLWAFEANCKYAEGYDSPLDYLVNTLSTFVKSFEEAYELIREALAEHRPDLSSEVRTQKLASLRREFEAIVGSANAITQEQVALDRHFQLFMNSGFTVFSVRGKEWVVTPILELRLSYLEHPKPGQLVVYMNLVEEAQRELDRLVQSNGLVYSRSERLDEYAEELEVHSLLEAMEL